jgi:hypothetical protein
MISGCRSTLSALPKRHPCCSSEFTGDACLAVAVSASLQAGTLLVPGCRRFHRNRAGDGVYYAAD